MANDIIDINVYETVETVAITVNPNLTTVNINQVTGGGGSQNLQQVTDIGAVTTNDITAQKLIKNGGQSTQFLKADGSVDNNIYLTSEDLPSTLDLYATTSVSDVSGYTVLVRNISDVRFNSTAVDVPTGAITTTSQLVGSLISDANIISGNPGIFNFTTIGNISRVSGTGQAEFFFRIYKKTSAGVETLIVESSKTLPVTNGGYVEFSAVALWNDGVFLDTDRIVIKYYADRLTSPVGSDPTYKFQFGGVSPVRSTGAVPVAVLPNIYLKDLADVENVDPLNNEILYWNDADSLWEHSLVENLVPNASATQKGLVTTGTQTFAGAKIFTDNLTAGRYLYSGGSIFPEFGQTFYINETGATHYFGGGISNFQNNLEVPNGTLKIGLQTASTIASFDANKNVVSLPLATYPSLTELTYLKGVTSAVQTQLDLKATKLMAANTIRVNNTAVAANAQEVVYKSFGQQVYTGTITWTGTTAPSGATNFSYNWNQINNLVTLKITLNYATVGSVLTAVLMTLPSDCPNPLKPTGYTAGNNNLYTGIGIISVSVSAIPATAARVVLKSNSANNGFEISANATSAGYSNVDITIQYFTS